ncbi:plastid lipid-associated protein (PAP)/fibrillin family [Synechococcus sp. MIT S9220]|uniref:PAP/fibrillin family protein n=1 Tax=unclassified Synechococcus TaxID=2626047 RepID=UPI00164A3696|nr:PAP/fibrillin family protein [Synechococcus sp. MIT S9220]NOL47103.1 PAP fibrillin [Synechococcus sp. MIT S9220]QNJ22622.1 plastid lipid-associated protein (PAP)/fibrillin family [Synechococcus sp. MIT S9220]
MNELICRLKDQPEDSRIPDLVLAAEANSDVDLSRDLALLKGVWELRWSSATQPWLKQANWLENIQILDPVNSRGMNLLRLSGPLGEVAAVTVEAEISTGGANRVGVRFRKGGWRGPALPGGRRLELFKTVNQSFPAWLDITALTNELRICRGNAGTTFALLKRHDMAVSDFF